MRNLSCNRGPVARAAFALTLSLLPAFTAAEWKLVPEFTHREDADWKEPVNPEGDLALAVSYMEAMHLNCLSCHREEAESGVGGRESLAECSTCHRSLEVRQTLTAVASGGG